MARLHNLSLYQLVKVVFFFDLSHTNVSHTHTSPCQDVPLTLVNEDLTLGEDLRQLLLELPVLLVIRQRLNRSGAQRRGSGGGEVTEGFDKRTGREENGSRNEGQKAINKIGGRG